MSGAEERCWCEHLKRWHRYGVCIWCARREARRPQFNLTPHHQFATEMPEAMRREAAEAVAKAIREGVPGPLSGPQERRLSSRPGSPRFFPARIPDLSLKVGPLARLAERTSITAITTRDGGDTG